MKAILVIDMPTNGCESCMFDTYGLCLVRANEKDVHKRANRKWCPLKPLPRKLDANDWHRMFGGKYDIREAKGYGWNACLKEIGDE